MKKIRLLFIEKDGLIKKRIQALVNSSKDIFIINLNTELKDTLAEIKETKPTVVIIDTEPGTQSCLSVIEIIKAELLLAKIIVSGLDKDQKDILKFVQARVNGFILKKSSPKEIITSIRKVVGGSTILPPILINQLFSQIVEHSHRRVSFNPVDNENMTIRESEVMVYLSDGMSNKEIGSKMQISTYTVKSHIHNIMEKLSLHTRLEIANHSFYTPKYIR